MIAAFAARFKPVQVMETLVLSRSLALTSIVTVPDENVDVELPEMSPHMLTSRVLTTPGGNTMVMLSPFPRCVDVLNINDAVPPAPTAVDMINPVREELKQPMQGLASRFTSKGVSFSKLFAKARFAML